LGDPAIDGSTIAKWIFRRRDEGAWTKSMWLRIGAVGRHL